MPKIVGKNIDEHKRQTKEQLFNALTVLLQDNSFDSLTMSQIALTANVGRSAVYNHFKDKESLLLAYIENETEKFIATILFHFKSSSNPITHLRMYIRENLKIKSMHSLSPNGDLRQSISKQSLASLQIHVRKVEAILENILYKAMEQDLIPKANPKDLVPSIHATILGRQLPVDQYERARAVALTEKFILLGIGANAANITIPATHSNSATKMLPKTPNCPFHHS